MRFTVKRGTTFRRLSGFKALHRGVRVEVEAVHRRAGWVATKVQRETTSHWHPLRSMDTIDRLIENNDRFAAGLPAGHLDVAPARRLAIVTCMDSRLDVFGALGLGKGRRTSCGMPAGS